VKRTFAGHSRQPRRGSSIALFWKPKDLREYVIVHEMVHLIEPTHSDRFLTILWKHYPTSREARAELNELLLAAEAWKE